MEEQLNRVINYGGAAYKITSVKEIEPEFANTINICKKTGKYPAYFWASRILKNGNVSEKQGLLVMVFIESKRFIKL